MSKKINVCNVKSLRAALEDLPDDRLIICQVVGQDGTAWNLHGSFTSQVPNGTIAILTFEHPELKTLPEIK